MEISKKDNEVTNEENMICKNCKKLEELKELIEYWTN